MCIVHDAQIRMYKIIDIHGSQSFGRMLRSADVEKNELRRMEHEEKVYANLCFDHNVAQFCVSSPGSWIVAAAFVRVSDHLSTA